MRVTTLVVMALVMSAVAGCDIVNPVEDLDGSTEWVPGEGDNEVRWSVSTGGGIPPEASAFFDGWPIVFEIHEIVGPDTIGVYDSNDLQTVSYRVGLAADWDVYWSVRVREVEVSPWLLRVNDSPPGRLSPVEGRPWSSFRLMDDENNEPTIVDWRGSYKADDFGMFQVVADNVTSIPECEHFPDPNDANGRMWLWTGFTELKEVNGELKSVPIQIPMERGDAWMAYATFPTGRDEEGNQQYMRVIPRDDYWKPYPVGVFTSPVQRPNAETELVHSEVLPDFYGDWRFLEGVLLSLDNIGVGDPNVCGFVN